jgi:outer membrane protein
MKKTASNLLSIAIFASFILPFAIANEKKKQGPPDGWSLGAGAVVNNMPYAGFEEKLRPIPAISFKSGRFWLRGPFVSYQLFNFEKGNISLNLRPDLFGVGYKSSDAPILAGMQERKGTINLGLSGTTKIKTMIIQASFFRDVLGRHNGVRSEFSLGKSIPVSVFIPGIPFTLFGLSFGGALYDRRFSNYYYGVRADETTALRPEYKVSWTLNPKVSASITSIIFPMWTLRVGYELERLTDEMFNSPIVNKRFLYSARLFVTRNL